MAFTDVIQGDRLSSTGLAANQKPDIDTVLRTLLPYQVPMYKYLFLSGKKSKPVYSKTGKFSWFEDEYLPHQTTVSVAITASGSPATLGLTTANCARVNHFNVYDLVLIEDNDEMAYVSASAATTATLTHVDGSTDLSSISGTGGYLKTIGSVMPEAAGKRAERTTKEVEKSNYLTIFSDTITNSGREQAGQAYTDGVSHAEQVKKKMKEMELMFERNFLLSLSSGVRTDATYGPASYGQGAIGRISTNSTSYTTLTETVWDSYLDNVFNKGGNTRTHLCGSNQHAQLNKIVKDKIGSLNMEVIKEYGVQLTKYYHHKGIVEIIYDPVMDGKYTNWGVSLDMDAIIPRHMTNDDKGSRKFRMEANVETPGDDVKSTKLLSDLGIQIVNEELAGEFYKT